MTMIAIALNGDHAEVMTDSLSYTPFAMHLDRCTKVLPLPHIDTILTSRGDQRFTRLADGAAMLAACDAERSMNFDTLACYLPEMLRSVWRIAEGDPREVDGTYFAVGYSDELESFAGYSYELDDNFEARVLPEFFAIPSLWRNRPSDIELREQRKQLAAFDPAALDAVLPVWERQPVAEAPETTQEWVDLACQIRTQRATDDGCMRILVGGEVFHTTLRRGRVLSKRIHTYANDEEFRRMLACTMHPLGQRSPCWCGSGHAWIACHGQANLERDCECGSGRTFRECCVPMVGAEQESAGASI